MLAAVLVAGKNCLGIFATSVRVISAVTGSPPWGGGAFAGRVQIT